MNGSLDSSSEEARDVLRPAQKLCAGRYTLLRRLGGGQSVVWLANDEHLRRPVALKFFSRALMADPVALEEFENSAQKCQKLNHPNIAQLYSLHATEQGLAFISTECVEGTDLTLLRREQPDGILPWKTLVPLVKQLCAGLEYAHQNKVLHCDLKPANLIVSPGGGLKITDFAVAAIIRKSLLRHSAVIINEELACQSPQQLAGNPPTPSDDIYALGATLYDLITSRPVFHQGNIGEQIRASYPPPLSVRLGELGLINKVPPNVNSVVLACLAKDPAKRPANVAKVLERLLGQNGETGNRRVIQDDRKIMERPVGEMVSDFFARSSVRVTLGTMAGILVILVLWDVFTAGQPMAMLRRLLGPFFP